MSDLAALNDALDAAFGPGHIVAGRVLQRSVQAIVAEAMDAEAPVIVKRFLGPDAASRTDRLREAHDSIAPHMASGPFRLAELLRVAPHHGLAVMAPAPGQRMDTVLAQADAAERRAVVDLAGGWLGAFAAPRLRRGLVNLHPFIRRRKDHQPPDLNPADRALTGEVLAGLRLAARSLAYAPIAQSGVHGDLTPYNLHLVPASDDGIDVWGFDLQPVRIRPVAQDAAQFLVVAGLRLPPDGHGPRRDGLPSADVAQMLKACPEVSDPVLRFFIGDRLLRALHDAAPHPDRAAAARTALRHWLEGAA